MKRCLIITSSYPYGSGEAFFSSELEEIAKVFTHIDLLPIKVKGKIQYDLPKNVKCLKPLLSSKVADLINILFTIKITLNHLIQIRKIKIPIIDRINCLRLRAAASKRKSKFSKTKYDLIYLYWGFPISAVLLPLNTLAPTVQRFHGSDLWGSSGGTELRKGIEAYVMQPNYIVVSSLRGRELLAESVQFHDKHLFTRYLGSEDIVDCQKTPFREGLSISSNAFLSEGKRIELIAKTVNFLSLHVPVKWTHIGGGCPDQIQTLRRLAGSKAKVFFEGTIPHSQLRKAFKRARPNLHLSLSKSEGLAINVLEAMSADIPIVSSDVGAMREAVTPQVGILVDETLCNVPEKLADIILTETQTNGLLVKASPRPVWARQFDAKKNAARFANDLWSIACDKF